MITHCNPLLKSYSRFVWLKREFYRLRKFGYAFLESDPTISNECCPERPRKKRKARR